MVDLNNVDASASDGIWTPCAGSLTPWGTHLGGEEYEPNAKEFENEPLQAMNLYTGTLGKTAQAGGSNPYAYGYKFEVSVDDKGAVAFCQALCDGRLANELGDVMPDRRTVYMGDDGRDTVMFMFVADKAGQTDGGLRCMRRSGCKCPRPTAARPELRWIPLGHASEDEVHKLIQGGIRFSDIFEVASPGDVKANPAKFSDFKPVYVYAGTGKEVAHLEYLKLKPGMEKAAAFLESRRYAALLGATSEFTKMEGVTHNARDKRLYVAMSYVEKSMVDKLNEDRPRDDINLEGDAKDMACGAVYEASLKGGERDLDGRQDQQRLGGRQHPGIGDGREEAVRPAIWRVRQVRYRPYRESGQPEIFGKPAHLIHRRGQREPPEQLRLGLRRKPKAGETGPHLFRAGRSRGYGLASGR